MDGSRFDRLARRLAVATTSRRAFGLAALAAALGAPARLAQDAEAARPRSAKKKKKDKGSCRVKDCPSYSICQGDLCSCDVNICSEWCRQQIPDALVGLCNPDGTCSQCFCQNGPCDPPAAESGRGR